MNDDFNFGPVLREKRLQLGLSEEYCAEMSGLDISCHYDVEAYKDEFFNNISLGTARRLCRILKISIMDAIRGFVSPVEVVSRACSDPEFYSRNDLISKARMAKNMSVEQLGDAVGIYEKFMGGLERSPDFIETMTIRDIVYIAAALDLDVGLLICDR
ncbi:MAG: helix-turn-helix domain-containing protein [Zavarzinia sp.]|nr:helix-turn-helix domain-containing protein [Zavarzinia sp.]